MMTRQFPTAPSAYSQEFFNQLLMQLRAYFNQAVGKDQEAPRVILRSPSGLNFDLTVNDSGVLVVTQTNRTPP
jgi:hypothetical protein